MLILVFPEMFELKEKSQIGSRFHRAFNAENLSGKKLQRYKTAVVSPLPEATKHEERC